MPYSMKYALGGKLHKESLDYSFISLFFLISMDEEKKV